MLTIITKNNIELFDIIYYKKKSDFIKEKSPTIINKQNPDSKYAWVINFCNIYCKGDKVKINHGNGTKPIIHEFTTCPITNSDEKTIGNEFDYICGYNKESKLVCLDNRTWYNYMFKENISVYINK